ncbi:hypothetical protein Poli38472_003490 [Pythium oligandrum]|uniref:TFIID subunit TAF5 NTD2 domain-containing protein n=1 Tax=Pythium oligandrum TaxID=41045 RepID=A0A8K1C6X2_PYTOL|nr:hypothetical protein Poli38472_003490 [Pythium oligandrum]|eukprot:TMW57565.1 hypothetical protein Poli38472_003490 [Pythium oligandrum]
MEPAASLNMASHAALLPPSTLSMGVPAAASPFQRALPSSELEIAASDASENAGDAMKDGDPMPLHTVENVMDQLMMQYLAKRGYKVTLDPSKHGEDVEMTPVDVSMNGHLNGAGVSEADKRRFLGFNDASRIPDAHENVVTLERYATELGLSTESCAANHILFYGLTNGDPTKYLDAYSALVDWICNSLDMYKYELHAVAFPVFVHSYLDLMAKGYVDAAKTFFQRFSSDHMRLHVEELRQLSLVFSPEHVRTNEYAQQVLHSKFNVEMSLLSFELLNAFLSQEQLFLILTIVNERINLIVTSNQPGIQIQQLEDVSISAEGIASMQLRAESNGYMDSDDVAMVVASSDQPNESEINAPLTSGEYNLEYMVEAAGGHGTTLADLHAIRVNWGVLPARKLQVRPDNDDGSATGDGKADGNGTNGSTAASGSGAGEGGAGAADGDKKGTGAADGASGDAGSAATKGGDKSGKSEKATAEAQRKAKRARLPTDPELDRRKSELEIMGPLPDRKNAFNAHILERLVLRQPAEMKALAMEDLRARATLNKNNLPSALCFSLVNSGAHINNMCFSDDVTMVGASCDDGSFRVWRNDDQPLGTARGSTYQGDMTETDEDEKTAVLRGHSSAVYGASFSPDNRFALTGSADSTVRLWSLAAKSNVVIYRSHEGYPVWDVRFGRYGYYFASCSMDRTARLWSTDHMTPLRIFAGHLSDVDCVEFHPNQNYIATGSSDKTVRLWDVQTGKCLRIFTGHFHGVKALAFSRNGRYLASSGDDQYINVWDLQAGKRLETLVGHKATVTSLDFSQESTILASSGLDSTVRLWDMQSIVDKPVHSVFEAEQPIYASTSTGVSSSISSAVTRPVQVVRPASLQDAPASRFMLKTLRSKQTPMYRVQYTSRNLLMSGGVFQPKIES